MPPVDIIRLDDDPHETTYTIRDDTVTRGVDLEGALITATYADGTIETLTWQALDPFTNGGATSTDIDMFYGFSWHELNTTKLLASLQIDLTLGNSVFDTTITGDDDPLGGSTPGSGIGFPFELSPEYGVLSDSITVTYSGVVNLVGRPADGDLYTTLLIDFSDLSGGGLLGDLNWDSDIDSWSPNLNLNGTPGPDVLSGEDGNDSISGLGGDDRLIGNGGNDTLHGDDGNDTLNGGDGDDFIFGGASSADLRDVVYGGAGNDNIDGGFGNDLIYGQDGNDTIVGGFGADELQGQNGNDVISGAAYSDLIYGGAGDDFVNGGFGHDRINGGAGTDRFFHIGVEGHGSDWIQDYNAAEGDVLLFGDPSTTADDFQVNLAHTTSPSGERSGDDNMAEAFVIYKPTGQIMWALVDGEGQDEINLRIGGEVFDLLA